MIKAFFIDRRGRQYYMTFASAEEMEKHTAKAERKGDTLIAACMI